MCSSHGVAVSRAVFISSGEILLCAKENREKVALLLQLSDNLIEKGHTHTDNIKSWATQVDRRYNEFSVRMEKYRDKLMSTLGMPLNGSGVSGRQDV